MRGCQASGVKGGMYGPQSLYAALAVLVYVILLYAPQPFNLTVAPIIAAILVAYAYRGASEAFAVGFVVGGVALLLVAGAGIGISMLAIKDAAGGVLALLVPLYHTLTTALLSAGFTILFRSES